MINFYKQDGIGKIAFNDGNIYVPQGNVTLLLDTTTEKIIVAEDERLIYWISLSQPLEVNGSQISGTDAEKLALIAPVFQNEGGGSGGTGGASARFGYPGEDATSDVDRVINMQGHSITINQGYVEAESGFITKSALSSYAGDGHTIAELQHTSTSGQIHISNNLGSNAFIQANNLPHPNSGQDPSYFFELPAPSDIIDGYSNKTIPISVNGITADATGDIPLVPTQSFDSNAEAVAALGVGKLYKSTTTMQGGSPIILITV